MIAKIVTVFGSGMCVLAVYHQDTERWRTKHQVYRRGSEIFERNPKLAVDHGMWDYPNEPIVRDEVRKPPQKQTAAV